MELNKILNILAKVEKGYIEFADNYKYKSTGDFIKDVCNGIFADIRKGILAEIATEENN